MKTNLVLICITFFTLLTSCITITITRGDNYNSLTPEQKEHIKKYTLGQSLHDTDFASLNLYEITPQQIKRELSRTAYTCVYSWTPHCSGPHCKPLSYYSILLSTLDSMNVNTLLVSSYYEYNIIQREKSRFKYKGTMLVEDKDVYGKHKFNSHKIFINSLLGYKAKGQMRYASYYLYKGDSLVSYGLEQIDAVNYLRKHIAH